MTAKWTIEDCDTCCYWQASGYRDGLKAGYGLGRTCDHNEYQRQLYAHGYPRPAVMGCGTAELTSGFDLIRRALTDIQWQSADKDNMEFTARITYSQMDRIRTALYLSDNDGLVERPGAEGVS